MPSIFKLSSAAGTNLTQIGNSTGIKCYGWNIVNTNAAARFLKIYWGAPGTWSSSKDNPTVGTDSPDLTIEVPALGTTTGQTTAYFDAGVGNQGYMYIATTTTAPDSDSTAIGAGDLIIQLFYG